MLVRKKISINKSIIYLAIIFFMVGGTIFMVYKSKQLTAPRTVDANIPMVFNDFVPGAETVVSENSILEGGEIFNSEQIINRSNQNGGLDLDIFSSDKFKNLQANTLIIKEQLEIGKKNPFKPN